AAIGRKMLPVGPHTGADHPVAGDQMGRQSARDPEADDARRAAPGGPVEGVNKLRSMIANHRHAGPERDAGLKREAGDCDNVPPSRHSTPSVQSKASSYAFFTSVINSPRRQRRSTVLRRLSPFPAHKSRNPRI